MQRFQIDVAKMRKYWENTIKNDLFGEGYCIDAILENQLLNLANGVTIQKQASLDSP